MNRAKLVKDILSAHLTTDLHGGQKQTMHLLLRLLGNGGANPQRANCYRICHAIARQYGLYPDMRMLMQNMWGTQSMRELEIDELHSLLVFMRAFSRHLNLSSSGAGNNAADCPRDM